MKYLSSKKASLTALGLATLLWTMPASAQVSKTRCEIPFQFVAGSQVLPAGQYEVTTDQFARILLRHTRESAVHTVGLTSTYQARPPQNLSAGKLRFSQYGGTLFLTAIWAPGQEDGRTIAPSRRLTEAISTGAANPVNITLETHLK